MNKITMTRPYEKVKEGARPASEKDPETARQAVDDELFMKEAIELSRMAVEHGNEPFGAVLVKDGEIVFTNENQIYTKLTHVSNYLD